ncbi:MAG: Y-family DNA polymerase [Bacteroidia bacterium]|nr:Y-family DNA polymerase [Bacteroidia bacterium]
MFALVDCNSFFCSVEKVFTPGLRGKPVCVAGSNDGNIVALTPEAKALGLHRGDPVFKVRDIINANNVKVFSGNMMLYAAMSRRIVSILRKSIMHVENYSIDESFCDLNGYEEHYDIVEFMRGVADKIMLYTDIPVSVGIAPTKTLAKVGSKFAKQYKGYRSVCAIDTEEKRRKALELFDLADVWGVGRHTFEKLRYYGIKTPLEFADKSEAWVRHNLTKPGWQTWMELNGRPCIDTHEVARNQSICTSRSFGQMVKDFDSVKSAIATFAASCANKLRGQRSVGKMVTVFVGTNRFREDLQQYWNKETVELMTATSDTIEITEAAIEALKRVFVEGVWYKKVGVVISGIQPECPVQLNLFDPIQNREERAELMKVIDRMNHKYGLKTIKLGVEGEDNQPWKVKCEMRTPNYLTDIDELMVVKG